MPDGYNDMPDVGTLGGTMADDDSDSDSSYYNGPNGSLSGISPAQDEANAQVNDNSWGYDFNAAGMNTPGDWSLGQLFGYEQQQGLPTTQGQFAGNESDYGFSDFASSPFGKGLRGLLGMTPFGKVANMGIDIAQGKPWGQVAANAVPGQLGTLARVGYQAANSANPAASLGKSGLGYGLSQVGGQLGQSMGGPLGGLFGSMAGSKVASLAGNAPAQQTQAPGGFNMGGLATGLANLYGGYQGMQQAGQLQENAAQTNQALQGQMGTLANMYAPDSAYAKQLAQQLARKDAAAGRNSQYGPRAVELQARLAAMAPQVANSMSSLAGAANSGNTQAAAANRAEQIAKAQMMQQLIGLGEKSGFNQWAGQGLSNLFSNNTPAPQEYVQDDTSQWT